MSDLQVLASGAPEGETPEMKEWHIEGKKNQVGKESHRKD